MVTQSALSRRPYSELYTRFNRIFTKLWSYPQLRRFFTPLESRLQREFVQTFFEGDEYARYCTRFEDHWQRFDFDSQIGDISLTDAKNYYALVRAVEPDRIVETGVSNGLSTLCLLLALDDNDHGHLYSVDYPLRADESLAEFREETWSDYSGSAIPADKDPGWIISATLRDRWTLSLGKSQLELPRLRTEIEDIDIFVHDSEHSEPCMMFEYELAWEWLTDDGILLSDDITWNETFQKFISVRKPGYGYVTPNVGYLTKQ